MWNEFVLPALAFARVATGELLARRTMPLRAPAAHLEAAVSWLERAQDQTPDGGVSYGYSLRGGWRPSYVETTGYIAPTFFRLSTLKNNQGLRARAVRMVEWLLAVQNPDGSFSNPRFGPGVGIVFDTGQDLLGLVDAFRGTRDDRFLEGARRAARWLCDVADENGRWTRRTYRGIPHVYNTRVAWALLEFAQEVTGDGQAVAVARANLDWALSQQQESGLFDQCAFELGKAPYTHTIAYAIRGLWESGILLDDERYRESARTAAQTVARLVRRDGSVPGCIHVDGRPAATYCCLTGNAQLAVVWAKMAAENAVLAELKAELKEAAVCAVRYVMNCQDLDTKDRNRRGAILGSYPVWGGYAPFTYPNWATKFFIDALLETEPWL